MTTWDFWQLNTWEAVVEASPGRSALFQRIFKGLSRVGSAMLSPTQFVDFGDASQTCGETRQR
jgi:hypothetical protein